MSLYIRNFICGNALTCTYFKEHYGAVQNVLLILLVNKHNNASKSATGSMSVSALCKIFTVDTHKSVAFSTNIMLMQCEGQSSENNIYESTLACKKPQPQICHYFHTFFTTQHLCV